MVCEHFRIVPTQRQTLDHVHMYFRIVSNHDSRNHIAREALLHDLEDTLSRFDVLRHLIRQIRTEGRKFLIFETLVYKITFLTDQSKTIDALVLVCNIQIVSA